MTNKKQGFLKWILLLVVALLLASVYLNFSIKEAIENEQTQSNIEYVSENTSNFYTTYLAEKVDYVWNDIFIDLIWNSFTDNMGRLKSGELTTVELAAPTIVIPE